MHKGKVIAHVDEIQLRNVTFRVRESGRQRVLLEKRKNVHAFIIGDWDTNHTVVMSKRTPISYNPYKNQSFVYQETQEPITSTHVVRMYLEKNKARIDELINH